MAGKAAWRAAGIGKRYYRPLGDNPGRLVGMGNTRRGSGADSGDPALAGLACLHGGNHPMEYLLGLFIYVIVK